MSVGSQWWDPEPGATNHVRRYHAMLADALDRGQAVCLSRDARDLPKEVPAYAPKLDPVKNPETSKWECHCAVCLAGDHQEPKEATMTYCEVCSKASQCTSSQGMNDAGWRFNYLGSENYGWVCPDCLDKVPMVKTIDGPTTKDQKEEPDWANPDALRQLLAEGRQQALKALIEIVTDFRNAPCDRFQAASLILSHYIETESRIFDEVDFE